MKSSVKVTSTLSSKWVPKTEQGLDLAVLEMATDIHREAIMLAPKESGNLVQSGRIVKLGRAAYAVVFGNLRVPYARRRHFENRKTPGSLRYLQRPGDSISRNVKKYLRNK
jgi:hypothetical protein